MCEKCDWSIFSHYWLNSQCCNGDTFWPRVRIDFGYVATDPLEKLKNQGYNT